MWGLLKATTSALLVSSITTFIGLPVPVTAKPSSGCGKAPSLRSGKHTLTVKGATRSFLLKIPEKYNNQQPYRLIFALHGAGTDASQLAEGRRGCIPYYGLPPLSTDNASAIYVAPNALQRNWYVKVDDGLAFIAGIINTAKAGLCLDDNKIFGTGMSSGAEMLYSIGCSMAKEFRGLLSLSGNNAFPCRGGRDPVAFYGQHGIGDTVLPIRDARVMRDRFVRNNGCRPITDRSKMSPRSGSGSHAKTVYQGCKERYPVTWIEFDGKHTAAPKDKGSSKTWTPGEMWAFISQFK